MNLRFAIGAVLMSVALFVALPVSAAFADPISLSSDVFVERKVVDSRGREKIVLEAPKTILPGDNLRFVINAANDSNQSATNFSVTNPIPRAVEFTESLTAGAELSVDGARNWVSANALSSIKIGTPQRAATLSDVTHLRWKFAEPLAVGAKREIVFRGRVR